MRTLAILYAGAAYLIYLAAAGYLTLFLSDWLVPKGISDGVATSMAGALAVDVSLVLLFGVQHSVMARSWFKQALTRVLPTSMERATYVWAADVVVVLVLWQWRPLNDVLWDVRGSPLALVLWGLFWGGFVFLVASSFLIDQWGLFGLRQAWNHGREVPHGPPVLQTPLFYRYVRHPMMLGLLVALWSAPLMTTGRLLFATAFTAYIFVGIWFEERALVRFFGEPYREYQRQVPMVVPMPGKAWREPATA